MTTPIQFDVDVSAAVLSVIDELSAACEQRDVERALACFIDRDDVVLVGSGVGERADGRGQLRELFEGLLSQFSLWFTWDRRDAWVSGEHAYAMLEGAFHARSDQLGVSGPYRISTVFERDDNAWRIALYHGSEPSLTGQPPEG